MSIEVTAEYLASQGLSKTFPERFWSKVDKTSSPNGCWLWTGSVRWFRNKVDAHGQLWRGVKNSRETWTGLIYTHHASWILHNGPVPGGFQVQHNCPIKHNPLCCNPDHLKLGVPLENSNDMVKQGNCWFAEHPGAFRGSKNGLAKLTDEQVAMIRTKYVRGKTRQVDIAAEFGVSQAVVSYVVLGLHYK